ncbi:MAG: TetR/AcrR family transcriptional regulator [Acidimicrobiia bacterium]|nr:TetR/AcrR family transcriptional regulator [Acidimicrobiia bacterium]
MPETSTGGTTSLAASHDGPADGRTARRDRNRDAVVDALLELHRMGNLAPTVAEVAAHSGVSHRSVFRYFDDIDELGRAAVERQMSLVAHLLELPDVAGRPLEQRVEALVEQRMILYDAVRPTARVARLREPFQPVIAQTIADSRQLLGDQLAVVFEPELRAMEPGAADRALAACDVLLSFESAELLRQARQLSVAEASAVLRDGILALLG